SIMRRILDEDAERAANDAKYAADFAETERKRAEEHEAARLVAALFTDADGKLGEGRAALAERRFARATELMREAAEGFARAIDAAVEAREHERLRGARVGLSELEARARAANAAELFDKALADGDLSVARHELAHAERALRETKTLAQRETARREASDVVA